MQANPKWFKEAVFYELQVKSFCDSNDDGIGDFKGLSSKLDYLQGLGIDCIWLTPFYESPGRDDGYDVADFYNIKKEYGTVEDFKDFLDQAHARDIKVIADLVVNHTSDQHQWFQESRKSKDNPYRDYYVWSDNQEKYKDARIIFVDTEESNWTKDEQTGEYYWHRFFHHQPDLNYENPKVQEEMYKAMHFWLDLGLDGFRCDAVPYLFEEEGTNCENLAKTHEFLQKLRANLDTKYEDRILLAEANQWPKDVCEYFGDGSNEFHMAFHFPLMPRIFMSYKKQKPQDIIDILNDTPEIPEGVQWCTFLRNHDELTLEMVTDEERAFMYEQFAPEARMKCNVGIRRRLAPLLDNNEKAIILLNTVLFALPGAPIIYYGDEIGMGDNIWLDDRNGVRTPMQWDSSTNGGFSKAAANELVEPMIEGKTYGFQTVNVAAQIDKQESLLNQMKQLIKIRKENSELLGNGSLKFLSCHNPHVLVYLRSLGKEHILVVNNFSEQKQEFSIELPMLEGKSFKELLVKTRELSFVGVGAEAEALPTYPQVEANKAYAISVEAHESLWLKAI